jgi:agmatine/peptidylarginine deiminase
MMPANISAKTNSAKEVKALLDNMTKDDFRNYYRQHHSRLPSRILQTSPQPTDSSGVTTKLEKKTASRPLPADMLFPGEFEEVKAVLITWPYIFYTSNGAIDFEGQIFANIDFDYFGRAIAVTSTPDLNDNSEMAAIFTKLAKAIDDNAEVWINIFKAEDSTAIKNYLAKNNSTLRHARFFVNQGNSYWYRDCGPVAFYYGPQDSVGFIDFEYYGGRPLDDSIPIKIGRLAGYPVFTTSLEYEGGNLLLDGCGNLFASNVIYRLNGDTLGPYHYNPTSKTLSMPKKAALTQQQVMDSLKLFLNLKRMTILPRLKFDGGTGHIDLYADLRDENNFVFSQMPSQMKNFTDYPIISQNISTMMAFTRSDSSIFRKSMIPFPRKDNGSWYTSDANYQTYTRTYSNHLFINKTIIEPVFADSNSGDKANIQKDLDSIKMKYPGYTIVTIDCRAFDGMGGAIHCITKQIPADNPVRIIHQPIDSNPDYSQSYTISAQIHNKSGIANATCHWRYKGDATWKTISLSPIDSINFSGAIVNSKSKSTIEYYLEATSNNGKTIDKPITAPAGFYSFTSKDRSTDLYENPALSDRSTFTLFQGPSAGRLFIKTSHVNSDFELRLISISGRVVYCQKFAKKGNYCISISTSSINPGAYIAIVRSNDGTAVKEKLTIMR